MMQISINKKTEDWHHCLSSVKFVIVFRLNLVSTRMWTIYNRYYKDWSLIMGVVCCLTIISLVMEACLLPIINFQFAKLINIDVNQSILFRKIS